MNKQILSVTVITLFLGLAMSCKNQTIEVGDVSLTSKEDSVNYALGIYWGTQAKSSGMEGLDFAVVNSAMKAAIEGTNEMTPQDAGTFLNNYFTEKQTEQAQKTLEEGQAFLEQNKTKSGVYELPSGIQYEILLKGEGDVPKLGQTVKAHYTGTLLDGTKFDSSLDRGEPFSFTVGQGVIKGWSEIVQHMNVGSKYKVYIPSHLAYGPRGNQGIAPNSTLIFEIELIEIEAE